MPLPATVTTNNWSDHRNSSHRPTTRVRTFGITSGNDVLRSLGDSATNESWGQKFDASSTPVFLVMVSIQKVGSPTDSVVAKMYDYGSGLPGTLLATSTPIKGTQLSTTSRYARFYFLAPQTLAVPGFVGNFHIALFRTGAYDASNYYKIDADSSVGAVGDQTETHLSSGTWSESATSTLMALLHHAEAEWYTFAIDRTANKLRCYSSTNAGQTWAEVDAANAPAILSTANFRNVHVQGHIGSAAIRVSYPISSTSFGVGFFNTAIGANTWGSATTVAVAAMNINVSGTAPMFGFTRTFSSGVASDMVIYQGATESIMGQPYRRIKITKTNGAATYDVVGSANTPSAALPGTEIHYDLRSCIMDDFGNVYIFYTRSDSSALQLRIWKTNDTFCTILSPATSSTSNSAAYPLGLGTSFWRAGENYIGIPRVDGAATKNLTCKAGVDAETAGNWTDTTTHSDAAEVTTSNPAALVADNEAGGKLYMLRVRTDDTLGVSDDAGAGTWSAEAPFRSGQVITGISAGALLNPSTMGLTYFNTAPATDEVQHDHL